MALEEIASIPFTVPECTLRECSWPLP